MGHFLPSIVIHSLLFIFFLLPCSHSRILTQSLHSDSLLPKDDLSSLSQRDVSIEKSIIDSDDTLEQLSESSFSSGDRWIPAYFFENVTYIGFIISGVVLSFLATLWPQLALSLLAVYAAHHVILFSSTVFGVYNYQNISHQLALFFGSISLGFTLAIASFFYQNCQFLVLSFALTSAVCCIVLDFFLDVANDSNKLMFLGIYAGLAIVCFVTASCFTRTSFLIYSSFAGAVMIVLSVSVICNYLRAFHTFKLLPEDCLDHFLVIACACCVGFVLNLVVQCFVQSKAKKPASKGSSDAGKLEKTVVS